MTDRVRVPEKRYLGDGVYIAPGSYLGEFILTTEDGISVQNTIVLDTMIVQGIARFVDHVVAYAAQEAGQAPDVVLPPGQVPLTTEERATLDEYLREHAAAKEGPVARNVRPFPPEAEE